MKMYFITSNKGKFREVNLKLAQAGYEIVQKSISYPELQAESLEEVVSFGLSSIKIKTKNPIIIEDAGLFIKALNDFPGVYSSFVFKTIGCKGILRLMAGAREREALFKSVIALKFKNKTKIFSAECSGKISKKILGKGGFGYDPIFIPRGKKKTFAEMTTEEKNKYSHRGKAVEKLAEYLSSYNK